MIRKITSAGAGLALTATALVAGGVSGAQGATPSNTNAMHNAAAWLAKQDPGTAGSPLTSSIIALTTAGVGKPQTQQWLSTLESNIGTYIAPGAGQAGSLAKSIYAVEAQGGNSDSFGGSNMPTQLNALMVTTGDNEGRFQYSATDYSSGLTQAWAVLGLARTSGGAPADSISYLIGLQCPNGGFAAAYNSDANWNPGQYQGTCQSNSEVDTDTTSMALQALLAPGVSGATDAAASVTKAANYLAGIQGGDGSFSDPYSGANSNTTGLAAQALRAAGKSAQANKATTWLNSMQLTCANATTAAAVKQVGAVAFDAAALATAKQSGISGGGFTQWTMAAQQAIGGMSGAKPLGTAAASDQGAGLPTVKCAPSAPQVTKLAFAKNGKIKVTFKPGSSSTWVGKATGFKYRVGANSKSWGKWRSLKSSARSFTVNKTQVRSTKPQALKNRYVEVVATNAAGTSAGARARVNVKISKLSKQGKCEMPRLTGVTFGSSTAKVTFTKTKKSCVKVRATGATKWKKLKKGTSSRKVKIKAGQSGYLELAAGKARNKVMLYRK